MKKEEMYRGYYILKNPFVKGYDYVHMEYDGPEDRRHGWGETIEDCKAEIDERELAREEKQKAI